MGTKGNIEMDEELKFRLPKKLKERYMKYCEDNFFATSKRLRFLLEKDLNGEIKNK